MRGLSLCALQINNSDKSHHNLQKLSPAGLLSPNSCALSPSDSHSQDLALPHPQLLSWALENLALDASWIVLDRWTRVLGVPILLWQAGGRTVQISLSHSEEAAADVCGRMGDVQGFLSFLAWVLGPRSTVLGGSKYAGSQGTSLERGGHLTTSSVDRVWLASLGCLHGAMAT